MALVVEQTDRGGDETKLIEGNEEEFADEDNSIIVFFGVSIGFFQITRFFGAKRIFKSFS